MLWLIWHMWILLMLAFAGGVIAGWVIRSRSDEAPAKPEASSPPAHKDMSANEASPPAPHVPAPEPAASAPLAKPETEPRSESKSESKPKSASKSSGGDAAKASPKAAAAAKPEATSEPARAEAPAPKASPASAAGAEKASGKEAGEAKTADDLTVIKGLGPRAAEKLAESGVTRLSQIAAWKKADIEKFDEAVNARGRIERDDWVGQAKALDKS